MLPLRTEQKRNFFYKKFLFISLFLIFFVFSHLFTSLNSLAFSESSNKEITTETNLPRSIQNSVWKIQGGENSLGYGTAFSIGSNLFVTNFHILLFMLKDENSIKNIVFKQQEKFFSLKIERILVVSALYDIVLFETKESVISYLNIARNPPHSHGELFVLGYPQEEFTEIKKTGKIVSEGYHLYKFPVNHSDLKGASGGPVLNTEGQVVGVVSRASVNLSSAVGLNHLKELITGNIGLDCLDYVNFVLCIEKEIENLKEIAKKGDALAQNNLATMYFHGYGIEKNLIQALNWYKRSAEQGFAPAQSVLAIMYFLGDGTEKNLIQALNWYKRSAEQGFAPAQYELAVMYYNGEGTNKDLNLAYIWMERSAEQGFAPAQSGLATMYFFGDGTNKDLDIAYVWMKRSAKQGFAPAQYNLGMYYFEEETEKNIEQAFIWMKRSAEQGFAPAQSILIQIQRR